MWNMDLSEYNGTITTFCHIFVVVYITYQVLRLLFPIWAMRYESIAPVFARLWGSLKDKPKNYEIRKRFPARGCFNYLITTKNEEDKGHRWALYRALIAMALFAMFPLYVATLDEIPGLIFTYAYTLIFLGIGMVMAAITKFRLSLIMNHVTKLVESEKATKETTIEKEKTKKARRRK